MDTYLEAGARSAADAEAAQIEHDHDEREAKEHDRGYDVGDTLEPRKPRLVIPADRMESAPESVRQVKPYGGEPNEVDDAVDRAAEQRRDVGRAIGGREGTELVVAASDSADAI